MKLSGDMKPCRVAKNEPAKPPNIAPIANAVSLVLTTVDAERLARDLVFPHRLPRPPDRQPPEPDRHNVGDQRQDQNEVIEKDDAVQRGILKPEEPVKGIVTEPLEFEPEEIRPRD